jgi:tetratricopeptide (TPR) repeat protein
LQAEPNERPRDGRALVEELLAIGSSGGGSARRPPTHRSRRSLVLAAIAVIAIVGSAVAWRVTHHPASRPAPRKIAADDHVRTKSAEAREAYRGAFTALHDADFFTAVRGFEHAVELDPSFAAAHLRLGIAKRWFHSQEEGRKSFEIAVQHRDELDARDRGLLEAAEPAVMRQPYDYAESTRRFHALLKTYPGDSELLYWLGWNYSELGEHDKLLPIVEQLAAIDPTAAVVQSARALTLFYLGDLRGAREAAIECRRVAPTQGTCAFELQKILNDLGNCDELETVLRAWMIASPEEPNAPRSLAELMLATGRPREAIDDMFEQARARLPESARAAAKADDDDMIHWTTGDFTQMPPFHGPERDALDRIDLAIESGDPKTARHVAEQFVAKRPATSVHGTSDADLFGDPTGTMLATLAETGAIAHDELQRRREAWVQGMDASIGGIYHRMIWAATYAENVSTPDEAADALAALPRYEPLPQTYWFSFIYGRIGRTFVLGGRPADGLPYLERATKQCLRRDPRDFLFLGLAREALGDTAAACTAYREVIARWGQAKPRSVTAEKAQQHVISLGCPPG